MQRAILTDTPTRPLGQQHVVRLRTAPIDVVRVGIVGLGERGQKAVARFQEMENVRITLLCDVNEGRMQAVAENCPHHPSPITTIYVVQKVSISSISALIGPRTRPLPSKQ